MTQKLTSWLIPVVACLTLVIILWVPFGLKVSGIMEEWLVLHDVEYGGPSERNEDYALFITTGVHRLRPLVGVAPIIGYELSPDSFFGFNLVMMALFVGKALILYLTLRRLVPKQRVYALLVALLFMVFPADGGLFTFRAISIHLSVFWYLLGVYLFIVYFTSRRRWALVGAWLATIGSVWIYEVAYPLIALMPLLLIWLEGRLSRRVVRASLLWYLAPLFALLYEVFMFATGDSYQSWVLQRSGLNQPAVGGEILTSLYNAYARHFIMGWIEAISQLATPYLLFAVIAGLLMFVFGRCLPIGDALPQRRRHWVLAAAGFAIIGIGYAPFLITPYRQLDWRVYYYSSLGGAICIGSLIFLLTPYIRLPSTAFTAITSILIGLATLHALNQHAYYADLALQEQALLRGVVQQVPHLISEVPIVVVDETGRYNSNWSLGTSYLLKYALRYVYADYQLDAVLCSFDAATGQFVALPEQHERCTFDAEGITLSQEDKQIGAYPYDHMVLVRYSDEGAELLSSIPGRYLRTGTERVYNPYQFVDFVVGLPRRFYTMFSLSG